MKKNIFVRILAALGGLSLWMLGLSILVETFFGVQITSRIGLLLGAHTPLAVLAALLLAIVLCAFGISCWMMLSNKQTAKNTGFVMQKGENGTIGVSVRSIEGLVQTCIRQQEVISKAEIAVAECRDGIVILLNAEAVPGVNIPLAVGALQKQIKQYVSTCTGVDVREVRVLVENTDDAPVASPCAVQEPTAQTAAVPAFVPEITVEDAAAEPMTEEGQMAEPAAEEVPTAEMPSEESAPAEEFAEQLVMEEVASVVQPVPVVMPTMPDVPEEDDDRPLHQRLFGTEEAPVFVPAPPELVAEPAADAVETGEQEGAAEEAEEAEMADFDGDAVMKVVAAMAEDAAATADEEVPAEQKEIQE